MTYENSRYKFRAWDKYKKEFVSDPKLVNIKTMCIKGLMYLELLKDTDYVWMQRTGLNDMNGKDIYEGDFVEMGNQKGEIKFVNASFMVDLGDMGLRHLQSEHTKILGNVRENPELLSTP